MRDSRQAVSIHNDAVERVRRDSNACAAPCNALDLKYHVQRYGRVALVSDTQRDGVSEIRRTRTR